jgi:transposase
MNYWTTAQKVDTILGFQKETKMRVYTKEFKLESVRLYIANGKNKKKTARELGITAVTLNNWIGKYMNEALDKSKERPKKRDYEKELKEKDKLIQRLEDEVLILKKSIGIFTKDSQQK